VRLQEDGQSVAPRFTTLVANVGLHYPDNGKMTVDEFGDELRGALGVLRAHPSLAGGARAIWVEQQKLPPRNARNFLEVRHDVSHQDWLPYPLE
jgi:hypothetical protein